VFKAGDKTVLDVNSEFNSVVVIVCIYYTKSYHAYNVYLRKAIHNKVQDFYYSAYLSNYVQLGCH